MAPKKGKGSKDKESAEAGSGKLKTANALKLRHILCEKESRHLQALAKLREGVAFDKVAQEFSEDKARHGGSLGLMQRNQMVGPFQVRFFSLDPVCEVDIAAEQKGRRRKRSIFLYRLSVLPSMRRSRPSTAISECRCFERHRDEELRQTQHRHGRSKTIR